MIRFVQTAKADQEPVTIEKGQTVEIIREVIGPVEVAKNTSTSSGSGWLLLSLIVLAMLCGFGLILVVGVIFLVSRSRHSV